MTDRMISIDDRLIGHGQPPYLVAEMSANHNGSLQRALDTITMAHLMGADAIKLQTYTADTLTIRSDRPEFQISGGLWDGYDLYGLYEEAHTPFDWHQALFDHARQVGITCFSSPFDTTAVDLLEELNAPAYKIASYEAVDLPLIRYVAQTGKPMVISTGMANRDEIAEAVSTARDNGCKELVLLHCVSGYPVPVEQSHLRTIVQLEKDFDVVVGLSDHTLGTMVPVAAVALGASLVEKHVTLSREEEGPDSAFSLEPEELKQLGEDCRTAWSALGAAGYHPKPVEEESIKYRRSLYVVENIKAGEALTENNIRSIRPGYGLAPRFYDEVLGRLARIDLEAGKPLAWTDLEPDD